VIGEGEQHTLGGMVVASQLRRTGALVKVLLQEPWSTLPQHVQTGDYDAVLFSCSRVATLDSIAQSTKDIRLIADPVPIPAMGGLVLDPHLDACADTGVDLISNDLNTLITFCEQRSGTFPDLAI